MVYNGLENWLNTTTFGKYLSELEKAFFRQKLANLRFGTILQIGLPSWQFNNIFTQTSQYIIQNSYPHPETMLIADDTAIPWKEQSIDTLIWPHGLDTLANTEHVLAEIDRILVPGGYLLLTGLNKNGYWRFFQQRHSLLQSCRPRTVATIVAKLQNYHLFMTEGQFIGYGLPKFYGDKHQTIELMGNRWWPHLAAIYGLVLVKRTIPLTMLTNQSKKRQTASKITNVKPALL